MSYILHEFFIYFGSLLKRLVLLTDPRVCTDSCKVTHTSNDDSDVFSHLSPSLCHHPEHCHLDPILSYRLFMFLTLIVFWNASVFPCYQRVYRCWWLRTIWFSFHSHSFLFFTLVLSICKSAQVLYSFLILILHTLFLHERQWRKLLLWRICFYHAMVSITWFFFVISVICIEQSVNSIVWQKLEILQS